MHLFASFLGGSLLFGDLVMALLIKLIYLLGLVDFWLIGGSLT